MTVGEGGCLTTSYGKSGTFFCRAKIWINPGKFQQWVLVETISHRRKEVANWK